MAKDQEKPKDVKKGEDKKHEENKHKEEGEAKGVAFMTETNVETEEERIKREKEEELRLEAERIREEEERTRVEEERQRQEEKERKLRDQADLFERYIEESGLSTSFQLIFAEILSKKIPSEQVFPYTAMRLRQIGKEIEKHESDMHAGVDNEKKLIDAVSKDKSAASHAKK